MTEISIIVAWIGMALATWGCVDLLNRGADWVERTVSRIRDIDLCCDPPDIEDIPHIGLCMAEYEDEICKDCPTIKECLSQC